MEQHTAVHGGNSSIGDIGGPGSVKNENSAKDI
jgi:hypothetical protein